MEGAFLIEVSRRIKLQRIEKRFTVQELADKSGVSKGLISQIENGRSIPSLPVIFSIIQSLELEVSEFFKDLNLGKTTILIQKKRDYEKFEKEAAKGFEYQRILTRSMAGSTMDFVLLELAPDAYRECVSTEAFEYIYISRGEVEYHINDTSYLLEEGDSIFFDGRLPHVPKNTTDKTCVMLVIYFFNQN